MANFEIIMPKLGESIEEATITKWFVKPGDKIEDDDVLLEIATDKVDSEIPSPVSGTIVKLNYEQDETVPVGTVIAIIDTSGADLEITEEAVKTEPVVEATEETSETIPASEPISNDIPGVSALEQPQVVRSSGDGQGRFFSPLVLTIAREEGISMTELESIPGSGKNGRVQKKDILNHLKTRSSAAPTTPKPPETPKPESVKAAAPAESTKPKVSVSVSGEDEIIEMDRLRKLIADHMIMSKQTSAHVTKMLEADVTDIVLWRNRIKNEFQEREGEKVS